MLPQTQAMPLLVATMLCASDPGSSTIAPTLQFHPEGAAALSLPHCNSIPKEQTTNGNSRNI